MDLLKYKADELATYIIRRLQDELPGFRAHEKMAPEGRVLFHSGRDQARESAVLIHLYKHNEQWHTCFIQRPQYDGVHSGQIAFPGGGRERTDRTIMETALREAHEEVNIATNQIKVLGNLSPIYIPPSNYLVTPIVSISSQRPDFKPQIAEVDKIEEIPLSAIMDTGKIQSRIFYPGTAYEIKAPCYRVNDIIIWGATAMILYEFISILR
ncbi:MAG: CoA pyrophosphatase [Bacteroidales bacterium]